jgi:hypothetical protein
MLYFIMLVNALCVFINGYCFTKAIANPNAYPKWYKYVSGFFTLYCAFFLISSIARL